MLYDAIYMYTLTSYSNATKEATFEKVGIGVLSFTDFDFKNKNIVVYLF